eukprot:scaffold135790_cov33-Tisochrysis_lutea.AAC.3
MANPATCACHQSADPEPEVVRPHNPAKEAQQSPPTAQPSERADCTISRCMSTFGQGQCHKFGGLDQGGSLHTSVPSFVSTLRVMMVQTFTWRRHGE